MRNLGVAKGKKLHQALRRPECISPRSRCKVENVPLASPDPRESACAGQPLSDPKTSCSGHKEIAFSSRYPVSSTASQHRLVSPEQSIDRAAGHHLRLPRFACAFGELRAGTRRLPCFFPRGRRANERIRGYNLLANRRLDSSTVPRWNRRRGGAVLRSVSGGR